jgi:CheY-like chemotaxis protein
VAVKRILVVDDRQVNLDILEEILASDYRLKFARTGGEAVEIASKFQPDAVLLDVMLPDVDGLAVCQRLRQLPGLSEAAIIMVSAKALPSEEAEGMRSGADAYVTKPFDENDLLELLRVLLGDRPEQVTGRGDIADVHGGVVF